MVQRSTTDVRSDHFTLSSDCWQYINNTKREELGNIQQECNVKITTKTCVWLLAEPDNLNTEAETKFIDLVSSVGNVKKMTIGRLYDKVKIQKYLPDTNDLVFQEENDLLSVLGPKESLTKLTNLLRDASGIQSFPVVDVSTDVVSNKKQGPDMKECQINILEKTMKLSENYRSNISLPGNELVVMPAMDTELEVSDHTEKDEGDVLNMNESPLPESRQMGLPQSEILADHVEETQEESRVLGTELKETLLTGVVEKRPEHEDHDTNVMKLSENYRSNIYLPGNELVVMPAMDTELEVSDHTEKDEGDVLNMNESPLPESRQMGLPQSEILADHVEETQEESRALGTEPKETLLTGVVEKRPEHEDHDTNVSDRMFCGFTHKKTNQHIVLCVTDITKMKVDVIVSASNECLKFTGGVAKAISEAAGPGLEKETTLIMSKREKLLEVTETVITHGHMLPAKYVIHVVGPRWHKGKEKKAMADLKKSV